jgi:hypothetical protein
LKRWVTAAAVLLLLAAIVVHFSRTEGELASVRRLSLLVLGVTGALQFASQVFLNASMLLPLRRCMTGLGFWELYLVRTGGTFVGSLVPVAGGPGVRLAYLKSKGLSYLDFTWATIFSNAWSLAAAALLAIVATGVLWGAAGAPPAAVVGVSVVVLAIALAVLVAFEWLPQLTRHRWLAKWRWISGIRSPAGSAPLAWRVFWLSLARHALNFVTFGLLYQSLSAPLAGGRGAFLAGGLVYALTSPVRTINVTPANLGVTEWFVALVGRLVSFDVATGLIVSLAFRGVGIIAQALGAAFGSTWIAIRSRA